MTWTTSRYWWSETGNITEITIDRLSGINGNFTNGTQKQRNLRGLDHGPTNA